MRTLTLLALVGAAACKPPPDDSITSEPESGTVVLARAVEFAGGADGVSEGFDLDNAVTARGDNTGCGIQDYTSPNGAPGIDNAFASLMPVIAATGGQALPDLVQNAVTSGELLLLFAMSPEDADGCIPIEVARGGSAPMIGTNGLILPGQTFEIDRTQPSANVTCAHKQPDGSVLGSGLTLRLPLHVFDETIDLSMTDGTVSLTDNGDGTFHGVVSGGVSTAEVNANVQGFDAIPSALVGAIGAALNQIADLAPDGSGTCQQMSTSIVFEGVPAFLFPDDGSVPADTDAPMDTDAG